MNGRELFYKGSGNVKQSSEYENSKWFPQESRKHKVKTKKMIFLLFHLKLLCHRKCKNNPKLHLFDP